MKLKSFVCIGQIHKVRIFAKELKNKIMVKIRVGFVDKWEVLLIGFNPVVDFEIAIAIVRASKLKNVFLRQVNSLGIKEWDNL